MKIKEYTYNNRRDFKAIYMCEECGFTKEAWGYDDRNFHDNVVPNMKCDKCGKSRVDMGISGEFVQTKYEEGFQV